MTQTKQSKKQDTRSLVAGSLIIAFMLFIPYAFYLYRNFPDVETYEIFEMTFTSNYYESVRYFFHALFSKLYNGLTIAL